MKLQTLASGKPVQPASAMLAGLAISARLGPAFLHCLSSFCIVMRVADDGVSSLSALLSLDQEGGVEGEHTVA